jgi:hypothetical protein
VFDFLSY